MDDRQGSARYLDAVRHHWLLVAVIVLAGVGAALAYSLTAEKRYEASTDVLVTPIESGDPTFIGINVLREGSQSRSVLTASRLADTPQVAERVIDDLGLDESPEELLRSVEIQPQEQSNILTIVATAADPARAAEIANGFADALIELRTEAFQDELDAVVERLRRQLSAIPPAERSSPEAVAISQRLGDLSALTGGDDPTLHVSSSAVPPTAAAWPRPVLSVAVALVASLLLGVGVAVALELTSPRVKDEESLLLDHRLPILAQVPRMKSSVLKGYLTGREPLPGDVREAYRTLRASLATAGPDGRFPSTVLITSAVPGEGKTMTAMNLATTLAMAGHRVVLVDGDLRRPMLGTLLGLPARRAAFAEILLGGANPSDALTPVSGFGDRLRLLPAHPEHGHLVDVLQPDRVAEVFNELRLDSDVIVVDSPPLTEVADALILADQADAVLVAVRLGKTSRDALSRLRRMLSQAGITPAGFVVTTRRRSRRHGYYGASAEAGSERGPMIGSTTTDTARSAT